MLLCVLFLLHAYGLVRSPGVTGKSERAGHNSVALPTAAGRREGDRICPALTDFPVTPGDIHSTARPFLMAALHFIVNAGVLSSQGDDFRLGD